MSNDSRVAGPFSTEDEARLYFAGKPSGAEQRIRARYMQSVTERVVDSLTTLRDSAADLHTVFIDSADVRVALHELIKKRDDNGAAVFKKFDALTAATRAIQAKVTLINRALDDFVCDSYGLWHFSTDQEEFLEAANDGGGETSRKNSETTPAAAILVSPKDAAGKANDIVSKAKAAAAASKATRASAVEAPKKRKRGRPPKRCDRALNFEGNDAAPAKKKRIDIARTSGDLFFQSSDEEADGGADGDKSNAEGGAGGGGGGEYEEDNGDADSSPITY